jgi:hypothetical protein
LMSQPGLPALILTAAQAEPPPKPSQMLDKRVWPLRVDLGLKLSARSRGTSKSMPPTSVSSHFDGRPLRELPEPRPAGSCFS